jgi:hypothetical protein
MANFNALKKKKGSNLKAMAEKLEGMNKGSGAKKDERIYKPGFDKKEGIGNAVIRLLPAQEGDNFVRQFSHSFNVGNNFYWENSRSTIDEKDPVGISNGLYWQLGEKADNAEDKKKFQNVARNRKRRTKYFFNVYVEKDKNNPDCEGQVMIMECGPQIFKVIEGAINPKFEDDDPVDPFDLWSGAPLKIRAIGHEIPDQRTGNKVVVPNYEESLFGNVGEFMGGDEDKMKEIFEKTYDLSEFATVKSFDELSERFKAVTGEDYDKLDKTSEDHAKEAEDDFRDQYKEASGEDDSSSKGKEPEPEVVDEVQSKPNAVEDDDDDDLLSEFERLANGD